MSDFSIRQRGIQCVFSYLEISDLPRRNELLVAHCFLLHSVNCLQMDVGIGQDKLMALEDVKYLAFKQRREFRRCSVLWYWSSLRNMSTYIWWFLYIINKLCRMITNAMSWLTTSVDSEECRLFSKISVI